MWDNMGFFGFSQILFFLAKFTSNYMQLLCISINYRLNFYFNVAKSKKKNEEQK